MKKSFKSISHPRMLRPQLWTFTNSFLALCSQSSLKLRLGIPKCLATKLKTKLHSNYLVISTSIFTQDQISITMLPHLGSRKELKSMGKFSPVQQLWLQISTLQRTISHLYSSTARLLHSSMSLDMLCTICAQKLTTVDSLEPQLRETS